MDRPMDEHLSALKRDLVKMSALAETMITAATQILVDQRLDVLPSIQEHERDVNRMQVEIDEQCLNLIALHQPTAGDLRFILGVAKTNAELERLADQAVNISQKAERLCRLPPIPSVSVLAHMASLARQMLKDSLHAFVTRDALRARDVLRRDDEVDDLKVQVTKDLVGLMLSDRAAIQGAIDLILVARNVERIGDHATNIAENTIFVVEGRDVRHHMEG